MDLKDFAVNMRVHAANPGPQRVAVQRGGRDTTATVEGIEIELESVDEGHGSFKLRYDGPELVKAALELFKPGTIITFTPSKG